MGIVCVFFCFVTYVCLCLCVCVSDWGMVDVIWGLCVCGCDMCMVVSMYVCVCGCK